MKTRQQEIQYNQDKSKRNKFNQKPKEVFQKGSGKFKEDIKPHSKTKERLYRYSDNQEITSPKTKSEILNNYEEIKEEYKDDSDDIELEKGDNYERRNKSQLTAETPCEIDLVKNEPNTSRETKREKSIHGMMLTTETPYIVNLTKESVKLQDERRATRGEVKLEKETVFSLDLQGRSQIRDSEEQNQSEIDRKSVV